MSLTPVEIQHSPSPGLWATSAGPPDELLGEIQASFEDVWRDRADLRDELERLEARARPAQRSRPDGLSATALFRRADRRRHPRAGPSSEADVILDGGPFRARELTATPRPSASGARRGAPARIALARDRLRADYKRIPPRRARPPRSRDAEERQAPHRLPRVRPGPGLYWARWRRDDTRMNKTAIGHLLDGAPPFRAHAPATSTRRAPDRGRDRGGDLRQSPRRLATATLNREIDYTLEENSGHVLTAIDDALGRIESGTFGHAGAAANRSPRNGSRRSRTRIGVSTASASKRGVINPHRG